MPTTNKKPAKKLRTLSATKSTRGASKEPAKVRVKRLTKKERTAVCKLIFLELEQGVSVVKTLGPDRKEGYPALSTFYLWLDKDAKLSDIYARACTRRTDKLFEEIIEIADDGTNDYTTDEDGKETLNNEHVQRSKLRIDARKWFLSKLNPVKYGDKIEHSGDTDRPIKIIIE